MNTITKPGVLARMDNVADQLQAMFFDPTGLREARATVERLAEAVGRGDVSRTRPTLSVTQSQMVSCGELDVPENIVVTFRGDVARELLAALADLLGDA